MTTKSKNTTVLDDPIAAALEALDAPRQARASADEQVASVAARAAREPVQRLLAAILAEARAAGTAVAQQRARPLADGWPVREAHLQPEALRRFDGVLQSLTTAAQRAEQLVGECARLIGLIDGADAPGLARIERDARELIAQIDATRARGAAALAECEEAAEVFAEAVAVHTRCIAWLRPASPAEEA